MGFSWGWTCGPVAPCRPGSKILRRGMHWGRRARQGARPGHGWQLSCWGHRSHYSKSLSVEQVGKAEVLWNHYSTRERFAVYWTMKDGLKSLFSHTAGNSMHQVSRQILPVWRIKAETFHRPPEEFFFLQLCVCVFVQLEQVSCQWSSFLQILFQNFFLFVSLTYNLWGYCSPHHWFDNLNISPECQEPPREHFCFGSYVWWV